MKKNIEDRWVEGNPSIHYNVIGKGPPVVFLHGIGGNSTNWFNQLHALRDLCTGIAWDARGYGKSDDYEETLNFFTFSDDLLTLLKACRIKKAHLVGLSMGARILMDFYHKYPEYVATLTLCDCFLGFKKSLDSAEQKKFIELRKKPLTEGKSMKDIAPNIIESLVSPNCPTEPREILRRSLANIHVPSYIKTIEASVKHKPEGRIADIAVPVQLIFGEYDTLTPPQMGKKMESQIKNSRLDVILNAGHVSNIEKPAEFNNILKNFITAHLTESSFL